MKRLYRLRAITSIVMACLMIFTFAACGSKGKPVESEKPSDSGKSSDSNVVSQYDNKKSDKMTKDPGPIKIDDCVALYKSYEIMKDSDGNDALVVYYDFTNNSDTEDSFGWTINPKYYQDGVELDYAVVWKGDTFDTVDETSNTSVRPGTSIEVATCSKLRNTESPVEVICKGFGTDEGAEFKIDLK